MSNPTTPRFQHFDSDGNPLAGGYLYSFEAGTTTPLSCYSDAALTTPLANPQVLDANGELPRFYMLDQLYKFRLTEAGGSPQLWEEDNVPGNRSDQDATPDRLAQAISDPITQGAVGDGVADESAEVQAAIDASTGTVDLLGKTFRCDNTLTFKAGLRIKGSGAHLDFSNSTDNSYLEAIGTLSNAITFSTDGAEHATTIRINGNTGLSAGSHIYIFSTDIWAGGNSVGEIAQIESITSVGGGQYDIVLRSALQNGYLTASGASIRLMNTVDDISIEDVTITCGSPASGFCHPIYLEICNRVRIDKLTINDAAHSAIEVVRSVDAVISQSTFNGCTRSVNFASASRNMTVKDCYSFDGTSGFTTNSSNNIDGVVSRVEFINCHSVNNSTEGFTVGSVSRDIKITDCSAEGVNSSEVGVGVYGVNATVDGCRFQSIGGSGIKFNPLVSASSGTPWILSAIGNHIKNAGEYGINCDLVLNFDSIVLRGNEIYETDTGANHYPILVHTDFTYVIDDITITNNQIRDWSTAGIFIDNRGDIISLAVDDNRIWSDVGSGAAIKIDSSFSVGSVIQELVLSKNWCDASAYGMQLIDVGGVTVEENHIVGGTTGILYDAFDRAQSDVNIRRNHIINAATGLQIDSGTLVTSGVVISENEILGCSIYGIRVDFYISDIVISGNKIRTTGAQQSVIVTGHSTSYADGVSITDNNIKAGTGDGVSVSIAENVLISHNRIFDCDLLEEAIYVSDADDTIVSKNHTDGQIYVEKSSDVLIGGNIVRAASDVQIFYDNKDLAKQGISIIGNIMSLLSSQGGIIITATTLVVESVLVANNIVRNINGAGDFCMSVTGKITGMVVSGNIFDRSDDADACITFAGTAAADIEALNVSGNTFVNGTYGISISNEGNCIQDGNLFYGQATGDITGGPFDVDGDHEVA